MKRVGPVARTVMQAINRPRLPYPFIFHTCAYDTAYAMALHSGLPWFKADVIGFRAMKAETADMGVKFE